MNHTLEPPPSKVGVSNVATGDMLLPQHVDDLQRSGLSDATIRSAGFYSETNSRHVADILHWQRGAARLGPCLVIPYLLATGAPSGFARVKPDCPRQNREKPGRVTKYESPKGQPNRPYFTPGMIRTLRQIPLSGDREFVVATEGEKKSLAADQAGFPAIGLTGQWGWQKARKKDAEDRKTGPRELLDELAAIIWTRFRVGIIHDTDPRRNPDVHHGFCEFARVLHEHGAHVSFIPLPLGARGADGLPGKVGVDDFIVSQGADAFRQLIAAALAQQELVQ